MTNIERKIKVYGIVVLKEIYENEKERRYYAQISATFEAPTGAIQILSKMDIDVPISFADYTHLKKKLATSTAQRPILRIEGDLGIILDSVSFN